ncbi:MAG: F0F1 ATP synthase subunit A [Olegusella sp.]|nr:F0F1 ATP synthase subunit A [Olegusella sp.]
MEVFEALPDEVHELVDSFSSTAAFGNLEAGITQYSFWMFVSSALLLLLVFAFKKRQAGQLVPHGVFVNGMEFVVEFVRDDLCIGLLGKDSWRRHFPYLATLFFFVLVNDIVGIIPGMHPGTGSIGCTAALAVVSFIYFVWMGVKANGGWGYIKSLAPAGLAAPIAIVVWVIEVFSTLLRPITLAVRLFCNMYAGHIVMGTFAILAANFFELFAEGFALTAAPNVLISAVWILVLIIIYLVEMLVAVIQAYVFTLLTAVYISSAEEGE